MGGFLRRYPMPLLFLVLFASTGFVQVSLLTEPARASLIAWASTNLDNLSWNPVGTLLTSAFVAEGERSAQIVQLVTMALGLFPLARRFGNLRAVLLVVAAHVAGTLVSEGMAAVRLALGSVGASVREISDVGPSYVLSAALVATILFGPGRVRRILAAGALATLSPYLFEGLTSLDVAAVGHVVAMGTGITLGALMARRDRRLRFTLPALAKIGPGPAMSATSAAYARRRHAARRTPLPVPTPA
ncbi:rhomboid-like protein [Actinomadura oligospora]|uniref:rhomboid-like protein n=1 Tax=Actinomadura oligospora TaxID=111804 RepID=UPI00047BCE3B|nr:rhomboid-like protein [Actinomadura oligospora]